ncbi:MAG: hypothetical protein HOD63_16705 [Bacteroidetes bacterium]|nr:hypothetical protein [Bacteroidota bacterium]MBT5528558.1 hypothetical protein [Cytophagia bacterium]MBT7827803.1 hypothetical protein [Bacteroidota bacterium]
MKYKSISIDESIWEIIQNDAKPFEDKTPNDVLENDYSMRSTFIEY